ncbi:MAG: hypothetical protein FJZ01_13660 [Candidatus Sericytochromatia bacterium]|nr:hypothetical protein [Candidatus Tanganyikabacteria bacterium]
MPGLGQDRHTKHKRGERRSRGRKPGTSEDLKYSVGRVKQALRNSPTQILRAEDTRALEALERQEMLAAGYKPNDKRFLRLPMDAARRALFAIREIWGGAGLD